MTFYITPPKGNISIDRLEKYTDKRVQFLISVASCHGNVIAMKELVESMSVVEDSDCLLEGSKKDQISHFTLRFACAQSPEMRDFFITSETDLFSFRFSSMNEEELMQAIQPLKRFLRKLQTTDVPLSEDMQSNLNFLVSMLKYHDWEMLVHYFCSGYSRVCFLVPFNFALDLVSKRRVALSRGFASVPCTKWCDIMTEFFRRLLVHGMQLAKSQLLSGMEDSRIKRLFHRIKVMLRNLHHPIPSRHSLRPLIKSEDVDSISSSFPPCMRNLHLTLREKHRLKHNSRIQYTLFLKEMGLPLHEAINFWREEYSRTPEHTSQCTHSWEEDGKRYTYSIRHLYGLEGSRKNYRGHSCQTIQSDSYGGCPFKELKEGNCHTTSNMQTEKDNVLPSRQNEEYSSKCAMYLLSEITTNVDKYRLGGCDNICGAEISSCKHFNLSMHTEAVEVIDNMRMIGIDKQEFQLCHICSQKHQETNNPGTTGMLRKQRLSCQCEKNTSCLVVESCRTNSCAITTHSRESGTLDSYKRNTNNKREDNVKVKAIYSPLDYHLSYMKLQQGLSNK